MASSRGSCSNCRRLLQAGCHLCGVDGDALGAVVRLVDANQAVSKLKPERRRKLSVATAKTLYCIGIKGCVHIVT